MPNRLFEILFAASSMVIIVAASNYLVGIHINQWLTWAAFTYPLSFLVTELCNYFFGARTARLVVLVGFFVALLFSFLLMNRQVALASSIAFLVSQLLDISIFNRLRKRPWWIAPALASVLASITDTVIFFSIAFFDSNWILLALGDLFIKILVDFLLLIPFRIMLRLPSKNISLNQTASI